MFCPKALLPIVPIRARLTGAVFVKTELEGTKSWLPLIISFDAKKIAVGTLYGRATGVNVLEMVPLALTLTMYQ